MTRLSTLICLLWASNLVNAQVGFLVSPGKLFFRQTANQPGTQTVRVTNSTSTDLVLECSFADWRRDSNASKIYSSPGTLPRSNAKFLHANPENFALKAGESRLVEVTMTLPAGEDVQYSNSMLFITQVNEKDLAAQQKQKQAAMVFRIQLGVHVYNEPPQASVKNIDIEDVSYESGKPKSDNPRDTALPTQRRLSAFIGNIGERVTEGTVRFELTNRQTMDEWKSKNLDFNSMPGDKFRVTQVLPESLAKGKYALVTIVDFGADQPLKVAESEIEIL